MAVLTIIIAAFFVGVTFLDPFRLLDSDTLWHLKTGDWIIEKNAIPQSDPFSWSIPDAPWVAYEWLFEVLLSWFASIGPVGIWLFSVSLILLGLYFFYKTLFNLSGSKTLASITTLATLYAFTGTWTARPQLIGLFCFFMLLSLLTNPNPKKRWFIPGVILLWANCHPSVMLGIWLVFLMAVMAFLPGFETGRIKHQPPKKKDSLLILLATIIAVNLNPQGYNLIVHSLQIVNEPVFKWISEWQSPQSSFYILGITIIVMLTFLTWLASKSKVSFIWLLFAGVTLFATMEALRYYSFFVIAWAMVFVQGMAGIEIKDLIGLKKWQTWYLKYKTEAKVLALSVVYGIVISISLYNFVQKDWIGNNYDVLFEKAAWPVKSVAWLKEHNITNVFNHYDYGGYLIHQGVPVFVDGRADMYHAFNQEANPYKDWVAFLSMNQNPNQIVEKYPIEYALMPRDGPLTNSLELAGWQRVYQCANGTVLKKGGNSR